jgi:hypothetical protein
VANLVISQKHFDYRRQCLQSIDVLVKWQPFQADSLSGAAQLPYVGEPALRGNCHAPMSDILQARSSAG